MNLASLQSAFQGGILNGHRVVAPSLQDGPRQDREGRFKIYFDAYRFRLAGCLSSEYPALRDWLGDGQFGALVEAFIEAWPSRHPAVQDYCRELPEFLRGAPPWRERRNVIDFATFERELSVAFDAPDAPQLAIGALGQFAPEAWPDLTFAFHPSVKALEFSTGTAEVYALAKEPHGEQEALGRIEGTRETILFWRNDSGVFYRAIDAGEKLARAAVASGQSFGEICQLLSQRDGGATAEVAAGLLARWFADGLIVKISADARASTTRRHNGS
jgi:hypothetical protein